MKVAIIDFAAITVIAFQNKSTFTTQSKAVKGIEQQNQQHLTPVETDKSDVFSAVINN